MKENRNCWAVYFTRRCGKGDDTRQSIDLTYQQCREHLRLLRKMEKGCKMGNRWAMRRLAGTVVIEEQ
jgi:hypothetical protein